MIKIDFRPLEYIEVLQSKPLILEIEKGFNITLNLSIVKNFIYFNENYKLIFQQIDYLNNNNIPNTGKLKIAYFIKLIELLYDMIKGQYGFFKRSELLKRLKLILINDINKLIDTYDNILRYNSEIKKKLQKLQDFNIWHENALWTIGDRLLSDYIRTNEKGEKYLIPRFSLN